MQMTEHDKQNINQAKANFHRSNDEETLQLFYTRKLTFMQREMINFLWNSNLSALCKMHKASHYDIQYVVVEVFRHEIVKICQILAFKMLRVLINVV